MTVRSPYRLEFEQLEQRTLPSMLHLAAMSCFNVNHTFTGDLASSGLNTTIKNLHLGRLAGKATVKITPPDAAGNFTATLVLKTGRGNLKFTDTGHVDLLMETVTGTVTVGGTQHLHGASGQLTFDGSVLNPLTGAFTATLNGQVCIPRK
jgi:hypothetical protein